VGTLIAIWGKRRVTKVSFAPVKRVEYVNDRGSTMTFSLWNVLWALRREDWDRRDRRGISNENRRSVSRGKIVAQTIGIRPVVMGRPILVEEEREARAKDGRGRRMDRRSVNHLWMISA
jgi:hypothetical protein